MKDDQPNPEIDAQMPEQMDLRDYMLMMSSLGSFAMKALAAGDMDAMAMASNLQERLLAANPELSIMVDEAYSETINMTADVEIEEYLDQCDVLDGVDTEAVRDRVRETESDSGDGAADGGQADAVDIDIE